MVIKDKVAIVTGAGRGIGRGIALRYAQEGAHLALVDVDRPEVESLAEEVRQMGRRAWGHVGDLGEPVQARGLVKLAAEEFGRVDIVVNNAGVGGPKPMLELEPEDWDRVFDINVKGLFFCLQESARQMIEQGGYGKIINIASIAGKGGSTRHIHYAASKAAVISITRSAALTLASYKINVNAICPGTVDTRLWSDMDRIITTAKGAPLGSEFREAIAKIPLGRAATPADVAGVATFLASADSDYMTGQTVNVSGGIRMD